MSNQYEEIKNLLKSSRDMLAKNNVEGIRETLLEKGLIQ